MTTAYFITGIDTEIGKTLISSALLYALARQGVRVAAMKPVAAGAELRDGVWHNDDVDQLAAVANVAIPQALMTPYLLREPAAPHLVAADEGIEIDQARILASFEQIVALADAVVVEGVGGFRVPLSSHFDSADLAQQLGVPVILVVGLRLGCLNHALLTADAIVARGLTLAGWVANSVTPDMRYEAANIDTLATRLSAPLLGRVPWLQQPSAELAAAHLDFSLLSGWPAKV